MRTAAATSREALAQWCGHDALAEPGWHVRGAADVAKLDSLRPGRHRAWHRGRAGGRQTRRDGARIFARPAGRKSAPARPFPGPLTDRLPGSRHKLAL
ncbi:hypothetical protein GCM10023334_052580 [Nonomuraea thailandensis]